MFLIDIRLNRQTNIYLLSNRWLPNSSWENSTRTINQNPTMVSWPLWESLLSILLLLSACVLNYGFEIYEELFDMTYCQDTFLNPLFQWWWRYECGEERVSTVKVSFIYPLIWSFPVAILKASNWVYPPEGIRFSTTQENPQWFLRDAFKGCTHVLDESLKGYLEHLCFKECISKCQLKVSLIVV